MENRPTGFFDPSLQLALSIAFVTVYELLLKIGAVETAKNTGHHWDWTGISGLTSVYIWIAIGVVILSLITWLYVLRYMPLSMAFPVSQVVHALIPLGSWLILGETITRLRWCGILLVLSGLAVIAKPVGRFEERL